MHVRMRVYMMLKCPWLLRGLFSGQTFSEWEWGKAIYLRGQTFKRAREQVVGNYE